MQCGGGGGQKFEGEAPRAVLACSSPRILGEDKQILWHEGKIRSAYFGTNAVLFFYAVNWAVSEIFLNTALFERVFIPSIRPDYKDVARAVSWLPDPPPPHPKKKIYIRNFTPLPKTTPGRNFKLLGPPPPPPHTHTHTTTPVCIDRPGADWVML